MDYQEPYKIILHTMLLSLCVIAIMLGMRLSSQMFEDTEEPTQIEEEIDIKSNKTDNNTDVTVIFTPND